MPSRRKLLWEMGNAKAVSLPLQRLVSTQFITFSSTPSSIKLNPFKMMMMSRSSLKLKQSDVLVQCWPTVPWRSLGASAGSDEQKADGVSCILKLDDTIFPNKYCLTKIKAHLGFFKYN